MKTPVSGPFPCTRVGAAKMAFADYNQSLLFLHTASGHKHKWQKTDARSGSGRLRETSSVPPWVSAYSSVLDVCNGWAYGGGGTIRRQRMA